MNAGKSGGYGLRYALAYIGLLALITAGVAIISHFAGWRGSDITIGALIGAALLTYSKFLKDKMRLPNSREYWALVFTSTAIVVAVDFILGALVIHFTREFGIDLVAVLILIGVPLFKGILGNMLFYSRFMGERTLKGIKKKNEQGI